MNNIITVKDYQKYIKEKLSYRLGKKFEIKTEWNSSMEKNIYAPRLDIAIGSFAIKETFEDKYDKIVKNDNKIRKFIETLIKYHNSNINIYNNTTSGTREINDFINYKNNRCLFAIEIENQVSRKHLVGGVLNACVLGRVGILIPWTTEKLKAVTKLIGYFDFLNRVGKNSFNTQNLLIITKEQFSSAVSGIE